MNNEKIYTTSAKCLLKILTDELFRGAKLIGKIEDEVYRRKANGTGSVGGHFRHNLDFVNAFLNGAKSGKMDYHRRERNARIEENRLYAIKSYALAICRLRRLSPDDLQKKISIRSEIYENLWLESSIARELEFLHSHTVHHHALIAEKLCNFEVQVSNDFGVAPSTLKFWAKQAA